MEVNISTGNSIVDTVGMMNFSGNIVPDIWFKKILTKDGKPHLLAINILSDIVYWYRPTVIRDEHTDNVTYKKKFAAADFLQKSYAQICDKFNVSEKQVRTALEILEGLNVIKRHFRTVNTPYGKYSNVMFLELKPQGLIQVTFPDEPAIEPDISPISPKENTYCPTGKYPITGKETASSLNGNTYTKNTTEISTEITTSTDADARELLRPFSLDDKDIFKIIKIADGNIDKIKVAVDCIKNSHNPIDNVVGFLISAIKQGYKPISYQPTRVNGFANFPQRDIDYDELERILLTT